jgi:tetratricopeptide (TPR) repeat protein
MRAPNIRFIVVSAGLVAITGIGGAFLHQIQVRDSAGILLEQGKQKIKEGRPNDALGYLSRYTRLAPHNAEAQILLADTLADMGQAGPAMKWYEQALLRDASSHEARRRLVELAISSRRFPTAKAHIVDYLISYTPDDPQVYYLLGLCHEGLGEHDQAIQRLRETVDRDPTHVKAYALQATLLRDHRKSSEEADAVMGALLAANPQKAEAFVARADYRAKYRLTGVAEDIRAAVRLAPEDPETLFRASQTVQQLAKEIDDREELLVEAETYLKKGLELTPRFGGWYLGLAQSDRARGELDQAIAHIEEGLSAVPNDGDLQWNLADLMIQRDRFEEGLAIVERLGDQGFPKVPLEYLIALADARQMKFVDASERFHRIRSEMSEWPELARQTEYWLGVCYERLGEYGLQLTAFRNAVKIDPHWIPARQWLANALARTGRIEEAITEYEELAKLTGVPSAVYRELAKLQVLRERQSPPERRNWRRVERFLEAADKVDPNADEYIILHAEIQAAQQQLGAARITLEKGLLKRPDSIPIRLALAAVEQHAEQWDVAQRLVDEIRAKSDDTAETRLAELRLVVHRDGVEAYDELQEFEKKELDRPFAEKQQWITSLAAAYYVLGKYNDAGRLWQLAVSREPDNILLRMFLFDLALADGNDSQMQSLLADIRRIERSDERPLWKYGEATRLVAQARKGETSALTRAEGLLEEVRAARQTWSRIPLLQAEIDEIRGQHEKVVEHYLAAIDLGERSPTIIRRVVELLYRQRRYTDADNVLRRFEATQLPITGDLGRLAADVSFRVQDFSRAMQIAAQSIGDSDKYEDLVWMGQLHSVLGEIKLAEDKFKLAIKKEPELPNGWIALVQHFVRTKNLEKARPAIAALTKNVAKDSAAFVEAICLDALSDTAAAANKFDEASQRSDVDAAIIRVSANFFLSHGSVTRGEPLLRRLLAHPEASKEDTQWARRNLGMIWAPSRSDTAKKEAIKLVDENLSQNPSSADDRRAKAICLEAFGGSANFDNALKLIQELINARQSKSGDYLMAFRLCVKLKREADARQYLEQHTFENNSDPQSVARYIRYVLDNDDFREARLWIKRLKELSSAGKKQFAANEKDRVRYHRYLLLAEGFDAEALLSEAGHKAVITQLTDRVSSTIGETTASVSTVEGALILEQLSRRVAATDETSSGELLAAAESLMRSAANKSTSEAIAFVGFLQRHDRVSEAIDVWGARLHPDQADEFAMCAARLATHRAMTPEHLTTLSERLRPLAAAHRTKVVLAALAQIFSFQQRHKEAIAILREILKQNPQDVGTLNNLACYLALSRTDTAEALKLINAAIEIEGPAPALLDSRGMILLEMDRPKEALQDIERAMQATSNAPMYLHLATALQRLNRNEESEKAMSRAYKAGLTIEMLHPLERSRYGDFLKQAAL